ncbi:MAG: hypothetical protein ACFUZC_15250 [Chthoniobacteraceae bacterium]
MLLTGLIVAFFSLGISAQQISNSSATQTKVELFSQGAIDVTIGDLRQEIINSSSTQTLTTASGTKILYLPKTSSGMVPSLVGSTGTGGLENLLKISGSAAYSGGTARGCDVPSTGTSANGRYISTARWNLPLLIPPSSAGNLTPSVAFTAPKWILVGRDGSNPQAATPSMSSSNAVLGRYAYAIYNEGGLLDANVVGYPSTSGTAQTAYRQATAYVDLTQIGLTSTQSDQLVAWRNYASASVSGSSFSFPNFSSISGSNFDQFILSNTTGFLVTGTTVNNKQTDRMFTSRQELIKFLQAGLGLSATNQVFQSLSAYSRTLEQPSYVPDPNRPKIVGSSAPPDAASTLSYEGNNTYYGGEGSINLTGSGGFLAARVTGTFTRIDGTPAVVGEPLVKRRFALSRLQVVTTGTTASKSNDDPIYQRFGLYRSDASLPWTYDHGGSHILTLGEVAAANREPDFAELLKAAINAGSVGKAGPSWTGVQGSGYLNYQYEMDICGDLQILQIMANLIDQQKSDNYPTRIRFSFSNLSGTAITRTVYGAEDLPYFYRWHFFTVCTHQPSPLLSASDSTTIVTTSGTYPSYHTKVASGSDGSITVQLNDPGAASCLIIPQVWNPHDGNTAVAPGGGPTDFRVVAETNNPDGSGSWSIAAEPTDGNGYFDGADYGVNTLANPPASALSSSTTLGASNGSLEFSFSNSNDLSKAFREPTLLWQNNMPAGMALTGTTRKEAVQLSGKTYYGILVGDAKVSWTAAISGTSYIFQTSSLRMRTDPSKQNLTFRMQYKDASGNWVTYQDAYVECSQVDYGSYTLFVNPNEPSYTSGDGIHNYKNPLASGVLRTPGSVGGCSQLTPPMGGPYDPRSGRFSAPIQGSFTLDDPTLGGNPTLDAITMQNNATSASINDVVGGTSFVLMATQRPSTSRGQNNTYSTPCNQTANAPMGWYSSYWTVTTWDYPADAHFFDGLLSQNNPAVKLLGNDGATQQQEYYTDADGVCRRAMGAYVPVSGSASGQRTNTASLIGLPMATASTSFHDGIATPSTQSQSRPILLHRPFRSVAEMSYAFRGTPWKNIDFFTPESGDTALLDTFCVNEPPSDALTAGKVDLNTRQAPVLRAILNGAYKDEIGTNALPALSSGEASTIANLLLAITTGTQAWRGPLTNVADLVGHYVSNAPTAAGADVYQFANPTSGTTYTYAGLSAALSGSASAQDGSDVWSAQTLASRNIQRFREAPIRALSACGQTRVWNLLIDLIAQTGRFAQNASLPNQFIVEGEKRYWVHVAIDRYTGEVIDIQTEAVVE